MANGGDTRLARASIQHHSTNIVAPMNRREALRSTGMALGATFLASSGLLAACAREAAPAWTGKLSAADQSTLEDIADTILPTTPNSPGAKAAGVGTGIALLVNDCYEAPDQQRVVDGLAAFRQRAGSDFGSKPRAERERILREIDAEATKAGDKHWFHLFRDLSNTAYFSSEVGLTKAIRYVQTPGRWVGCVPAQPGQIAWG